MPTAYPADASGFFLGVDTYCRGLDFPISTFFPSKANPYFFIFSFSNPKSKSVWSYFFSSICFSAAAAVSSRLDSSFGSCTLNSKIIPASSFYRDFNMTSYRPKPLSLFEVSSYRPNKSTSSPVQIHDKNAPSLLFLMDASPRQKN